MALQGSLIDFFAAAWGAIDPAPFEPGWHFEAIAEHLEAVSRGQIRKLLINLPPRHGKTLLTSVAWPAWVWAQEPGAFPIMGPQASFLCLSYGGDLALDHALLMKRLVTSEWYQKRWGRRVALRPDKEAASKFDTTAGGTRISASISGATTGRGADYRIIDDPHNVKQSESQQIREETIRTYDQALRSRVTDPRTSVEVIVMQRTHEGDLSGHVLASDPDFVHLMLPHEFEPDRHCLTYVDGQSFWADPRRTKGELLWPTVWNEKSTAPFKVNPYIWAGQHQQRPEPAGGGIIKREWWRLWGDEEDPELEKPENARFRKHPAYSFIIGVLDTAYTAKQENDPSAMAIWGVFSDGRGMPQVMLAHAWRERLIFPDLMQRVVTTARKFKIDMLLVEDKTAGPPIVQELQRYYSREAWNVELVPINRASGDKATRLNAVVPVFTSDMVWAPNKAWANEFIDAVSMFPKAVHDEEADLTSMGLAWLRKNGLLETEREVRWAEEDKRTRPARAVPLYPGSG